MLDKVDDNIIYCEHIELFRGAVPYLYRLCATQRYVEDDRVVFVVRTILDDPLHPPPPGLYVSNDQLT